MSVRLQILATQNEWDAPMFVTHHDDGSVASLSRHEPFEDHAGNGWTYMPHAVLMVDGVMSKFDADRQPPTA